MSRHIISQPAAGIMIPVFCLRRERDLGIGDTTAMKQAIDFCAAHGFRVLQTLPIHDTVGDHSPYNPVSSRALSSSLLTLEPTEVPGLTQEILDEHANENWLAQLREGGVKHRLVHGLKLKLLLQAHQNFVSEVTDDLLTSELQEFVESEKEWLPGYTLFRVLTMEYDNNPHWEQWRPEHHTYDAAVKWLLGVPADERARLNLLREGLVFVQWIAHRQWLEVKSYADKVGVLLMGEMSFGVSKSSADVWCHPELFELDWSMGTRPVSYFDTNKDSERWGQNWGLPPYRWENHRSEGFKWLRSRVSSEGRYFHICRLDHLRGYFRSYMFPWQGGAQHAEFALLTEEEAFERTGGRMPRFVPGPDEDPTTQQINDLQGREIIRIIQEAAGSMSLFAELMGQMPDYMRKALDELEMPNLTFPLLEKDDNGKLNAVANFRRLSLVSYGNHDHAAIAAVYHQLVVKSREGDSKAENDLKNLLSFVGWNDEAPDHITDDLLRALHEALFSTPCMLAVLSITDLLGTTQRFNLPGSYGDMTWCERLEMPLHALEQHDVYGERIRSASDLLKATGR